VYIFNGRSVHMLAEINIRTLIGGYFDKEIIIVCIEFNTF